MPDFTVPEIQRTSLTAVILTLKCLGVHDVIRYTDNQSVTSIHLCSLYFYTNQMIFFPQRFPYLDRPEERFILEALKQLYQFDAIDRCAVHNFTRFLRSGFICH